jgi:uncharacterized membrane protein
MKLTWRSEAICLLLLVAMFVAAGVMWSSAPDTIPTHWGDSGEPDSYGGKFEGLLLLPLIALGIYVLLLVLPRVDPRREHYARFQGAWTVLRTVIVAVFAGVYGVVVLWVKGVHVDTFVVVGLMIGLLFMVLGNYMGKLRSTWFVGIRTPWTLSSEESWNKTHRLGGKLVFLLGLALVVFALFQKQWVSSYIIPAGLFGLILILYLYSYLVWRRDPAAGPAKTIKRL